MKKKSKHIHYAGTYLTKGLREKLALSDNYCLTGEGGGKHVYIAPVFDSGEYGGTWQRLRFDAWYEDCRFEVVVAASDRDLRESLEDTQLSIQEKEALIRGLDGIRKINTDDILLTNQKGRYLYWFCRISGQSECRIQITGADAEFPRNSFLEYFPEVYQDGSDFFERYISIFQSLYMDLEEQVSGLSDRLNYEKTDKETLLKLAQWIGLDQVFVKEALRDGDTGRLRRLIACAGKLQAGKGTRTALKQMLKLLYDEDMQILEYFKWYQYLEGEDEKQSLYQKLYGKDSATLTIMIKQKEGKEYTDSIKRGMEKVILQMIPFGMKCNLIFLQDSVHMDTHCYLDRNSVLDSPRSANVGEMKLYGDIRLN